MRTFHSRLKPLALKGILFAAVISCEVPGQAAGSGGPATTIDRITVIAGDVYVAAKNMANPDGCATSDYFVIRANAAGKEEMLSLLLSAQMSGRRISMWFEGCSWAPWHASAPTPGALDLYS